MSHQRRANCKDCGASGNDVAISQTGLCQTCGALRLLDNIKAMQTRSGPRYAHWLERYNAAAARMNADIAGPNDLA